MICPDSSVVFKWLVIEEDYQIARRLLDDMSRRRDEIVAPHVLHSEVTNVIRQRNRRGDVTIAEARGLLRRFEREVIHYLAPSGLHDRALVLADQFDLRAAYDAHYLALCEFTGATFWTADERLFRAVSSALPFVRRLTDYKADGV